MSITKETLITRTVALLHNYDLNYDTTVLNLEDVKASWNSLSSQTVTEEHMKFLYFSKVMCLRNLIDLSDFSNDEIVKINDLIVENFDPIGAWNDVVLMDALHQVCQGYKINESIESYATLIDAMSLVLKWPGVMPDFEGKILTVQRTLDDKETLICYSNRAAQNNVVTFESKFLINMFFSEIMDIDALVFRSFRAAIHAHRMFATWPTSCSGICEVKHPDLTDDMSIELRTLLTKVENKDKLHLASTFVLTCWRILRAIPPVAKALSLSLENLKDLTLLPTIVHSFFDGPKNKNTFVLDNLIEIERTFRQGAAAGNQNVAYGNILRAACTKPLLPAGPFQCLHQVPDSVDFDNVNAEHTIVSKRHSEQNSVIVDKSNVSTYIRLRASKPSNLTENYTYYTLKIGDITGNGPENGLAVLGNATSKLVQKNRRNIGKGKLPLFTFGPFRRVFFPTESNEDIGQACDKIDKVVESLGKGNEVIVMGFGVSGAGKTSTLAWLELKSDDGKVKRTEPGVVVQWLDTFDVKQMQVSVTEFKHGPQNLDRPKKSGFTSIQNLMLYVVREAIKTKDREKSTPNNDDSSRSHVAITIELGMPNNGKLHLVDLAGSEMAFVENEDMKKAVLTNDKRHGTNVMTCVLIDTEHESLLKSDYWVTNPLVHRAIFTRVDKPILNYNEVEKGQVALNAFQLVSTELKMCSFGENVNNVEEMSVVTLEETLKDDFFSFHNATFQEHPFSEALAAIVARFSPTVGETWITHLKNSKATLDEFKKTLPTMTVVITLAIHAFLKLKNRRTMEHWGRYMMCVFAACMPDYEADVSNARKKMLDLLPVSFNKYIQGDSLVLKTGETESTFKAANLKYRLTTTPPMSDIQIANGVFFDSARVIQGYRKLIMHNAADQKITDVNNFLDKAFEIMGTVIGTDFKEAPQYTDVSQVVSSYLTYTFMKTFDIKKIIDAKVKRYTSDRNDEGKMINKTLRDIQDVLIHQSKEVFKDQQIPDFVDACSPYGCHPLLPQSPCFQADDTSKSTPRSVVLDNLGFKLGGTTKVILMGVIDIGSDSKEPVTWMHDHNLRYLENISESLKPVSHTVNTGLELLYKSLKLPLSPTVTFTTYQEFEALFKDTVQDALRNKKHAANTVALNNSAAVRQTYKAYNQSSAIGIMQFLDVMGKLGKVVPCMMFVDDTITDLHLNNTHVQIVASRKK